MPLRPSDVQNIIKSGVFIVILFILGVTFTFSLSKNNSIFDKYIIISSTVDNAQNLKAGAAVQLKGIRIGTIQSLSFKSLDSISIKFKINKKYQHWIREDSYISIKTQGMLGDKFIEILGGSIDAPIAKNNTTLRTHRSPRIADFINKGEDLLSISSKVLNNFNTLLLGVDQDQQLGPIMHNFKNAISSLAQILANPNFTPVMDNIKSTSSDLKIAANNLSEITAQVKNGPGTLHSLLYDNSAHEDLRSLLGGAKRSKVLKFFIRESIKKSNQ